jgi:hypothetical protein
MAYDLMAKGLEVLVDDAVDHLETCPPECAAAATFRVLIGLPAGWKVDQALTGMACAIVEVARERRRRSRGVSTMDNPRGL